MTSQWWGVKPLRCHTEYVRANQGSIIDTALTGRSHLSSAGSSLHAQAPRQVAFAETSQLGMIPLSQLLDQSRSPAATTSLCSFGTYYWSIDDGRGTHGHRHRHRRSYSSDANRTAGGMLSLDLRGRHILPCLVRSCRRGHLSHRTNFSRPDQRTEADIESTSDRLARVDTCAVFELFVPLYPPASLPRGQSLAL